MKTIFFYKNLMLMIKMMEEIDRKFVCLIITTFKRVCVP